MSKEAKKIFFHLEDNRIAQRVLQNTLKEIGTFISTRSIKKAEDNLSTLPDVSAFFIDNLLEDGSGLTIVKKIRSITKYDLSPIFLITSTVTPDLAYKAMRIGVNETVSKLEPPDSLRAIVTRHLSNLQIRYIPRPYYEIECVKYEAAQKHFQYCPDLDKIVCADSPKEAVDKMRTLLEDALQKKELIDTFVTEVGSYIHRIKLKPDRER